MLLDDHKTVWEEVGEGSEYLTKPCIRADYQLLEPIRTHKASKTTRAATNDLAQRSGL
jgi:hypothetical protein